MIRYPAVSDVFYPGDFDSLSKQIDLCFENGPGSSPGNRKKNAMIGAIVPHAGYSYSGNTAAWAYKAIAESVFPDLFVILGTAHSGQRTTVSLRDWETPIGIVKNDVDFGNALKIYADEKSHDHEHSIEVQLPFLQIANKDNLAKIRICPILVNDYKEIGDKLFKIAKEQNKKVIVIASSDFTHYGPNYGYVPFVSNIKENLYKLDRAAINKILKLDTEGFLDYVEKNQATICGRMPIAAFLEYAKLRGHKSAQMLHYETSGDIVGDYSNAVGYASIAFY